MSGASKQRTRQERIDSLGIQKPRLIQWWQDSDKADFAIRISMAVVAAIALLILCRTWRPPFAYRKDQIPDVRPGHAGDVRSRERFANQDSCGTASDARNWRSTAIVRSRCLNLQAALRDQLFLVLGAPAFDQMKPEEQNAFNQFFQGDETTPEDTAAKRFAMLKAVFADDAKLETLKIAMDIAFQENYRYGLIQGLEHSPEVGAPVMIKVYQDGTPDDIDFVEMKNARIAEAAPGIEKRLKEEFRTKFPADDSQQAAKMISDWLIQRLPEYQTLSYDENRSEEARIKAAEGVEPVMTAYRTGIDKLAEGGRAAR